MRYRVNDIFYSLQGEGRNTGRAAIFVRFAGCNLRCPFCDTEFDSYVEMSSEEIMAKVCSFHPVPTDAPIPEQSLPLIVLTGGEPTLQVDEAFVDLLHSRGFEVAMESNGTRPAPRNIDWLTVSPKAEHWWQTFDEGWRQPDELKIVFAEDTNPEAFLPSPFTPHPSSPLYLQPCHTGDHVRNARIVADCVDYIKRHPQWRLSRQTHKLIGID